MKAPDPRLQRAEKLLAEVARLLGEIKDGVPPPRRRRKPRRRYKLPQILAALREGARLDVQGGARDPRLPSRGVLAKYRKSSRTFDREARAILKARSLEACRRKGRLEPTPGARVAAPRMPGRNYDWDAIAAEIEAGAAVGPYSPNRQNLPSHTLIMARRKADPVFGARVAMVLAGRFGRGRRRHFERETVLELIRRGAVIKAWPPEPGMPAKYILDRERREDPRFNQGVREAIAEARRRRTNRHRLSKLPKSAAWFAAEGAVPRSIEGDLRSDVVGELSLLLCTGEVAIDGDLQTAWRACRTRLTRARWKESSLDAVIAGTSDLRRVDLLTTDAERF